MVRRKKSLLVSAALAAVLLAAGVEAQDQIAVGPVAYVGHGALFDANHNEIDVTPRFLLNAQSFYIRELRRFVPQNLQRRQVELSRDVQASAERANTSPTAAQLMANAASLDLLVNRVPTEVARDVHGKLLALEYHRRLLERRNDEPVFFELEDVSLPNLRRVYPVLQPVKRAPTQSLRPFRPISPERPRPGVIEPRPPVPDVEGQGSLRPVRPEFAEAIRPEVLEILPQLFQGSGTLTLQALSSVATGSGGQDYRDQCAAAGVPIPPDWGRPEWQSQGILTNEFISAGAEAEVFTWESDHPEGMCIALPRWNGDIAGLLGIICLSTQWSKACFWDNQKNGVQFEPARGEIWPLSEFGGGTDLVDSIGGVCTSCHAGQNPYVIHPGTALGKPQLDGLPLFSDDWYEPIVKATWPQNPGPLNETNVCTNCHNTNGTGGAFPIINQELGGYCGILNQAVMETMPQGAPGSQANHMDVADLQAMCNDAPPDDDIVIGGPSGSLPTGVAGFGTEDNVRVTRANDGSTRRVWGTRQYADVTATANAYCDGLAKGTALSWVADDCGEDESSYMRFNPDSNVWETKSSGSANNEPGLCRYPLLSSVNCAN